MTSVRSTPYPFLSFAAVHSQQSSGPRRSTFAQNRFSNCVPRDAFEQAYRTVVLVVTRYVGEWLPTPLACARESVSLVVVPQVHPGLTGDKPSGWVGESNDVGALTTTTLAIAEGNGRAIGCRHGYRDSLSRPALVRSCHQTVYALCVRRQCTQPSEHQPYRSSSS